MKKYALAAAAAMVFGGSAMAEDAEISAEIGMDYASKYVWRGQPVNDEPVLQPSVTLSAGGFSLNVWGSVDLTNFGDESGAYSGRESVFQEVDYTLSYGMDLDSVSVEAGYIYYDFPGSGASGTAEVYMGVGVCHPGTKPDSLLRC
jgi:uncharacterized protein (TIGR02001 family)